MATVDTSIWLLTGLAAWTGFIHTLLGPDHYVPFVAMSRIGNWSNRKTIIITFLCGLGHVLSSVVLGLIGIAIGAMVSNLELIESHRGEIAGWLLLGFGLAYTLWGIRTAIRNRPHSHVHVHDDGTVHSHGHTHQGEHLHPHVAPYAANDAAAPNASEQRVGSATPWILFTIFLFGPCEPLIPLLMVPAAALGHWSGVLLVSSVFAVVTIATMITLVMLARTALRPQLLARFGRYSHVFAGLTIFACGLAIKVGL